MPIIIDKEAGLITLQTRSTEYQMKVDRQGMLLHTYYGGPIGGSDMSSAIFLHDRGFSGNLGGDDTEDRTLSPDLLPQEYSCFGTGDYRVSALCAEHISGAKACALRVDRYWTEPGKYALEGLPAVYAAESEAESLFVRMKDPYAGMAVELQYSVLESLDVITRSVKIMNTGRTKILLQKAASVNLDWQFGDPDWITFYGRHAMERNPERRPVRHGIQSVGSVRGTSSHHYNPFSILCEPSATETAGLCYGVSFVYSGEFLMEVERDQVSQTRLVCGIHPDDFTWNLRPGDSFQAPEVILSCSTEGLGKLSRNFHRVIREHICRGEWKNKRRPVLINNWEATYFDFTGDKLVSLAKEAADLGIELFVMDDGWFGKRDDDHSGLGDWYPNEVKLGCSLKELGDRITGTGMKFGVWFEPESISEDSNLYRTHPEWAVKVPGRAPVRSRSQLVLDLSNKEVQDYIIERMTEILSSSPISYVKWDFNRSICDKFSSALKIEQQGEFAHRYVLGLYRVLETLTGRFPHILFEGCSGGGGRFDAGMLYYTPQIWCSDNTDAVSRTMIQYGTSFGYPVSAVGAHVSAVPNHQTGRTTPLSTRAAVAMSGTFGYELDVAKLSAEEKQQIRKQIRQFHKYYDLIQNGEYYRLTSPEDPCMIWEFADDEGDSALIFAVSVRIEANPAPVHFAVRGLADSKKYDISIRRAGEDQEIKAVKAISGAGLRNGGITLPAAEREYQSFVISIESK